MPPRPKKAAAKTPGAPPTTPGDSTPGAPPTTPDDGGTPPEGDEGDPAAETCPFNPETENGQWTLWHIEREPQAAVLVPAKNKKEHGLSVLLARINGVAFWAQRGIQKYVPESVARIAYEADLSVLPVDGAVAPTFAGAQPPLLAGAPDAPAEAAGG